jgi:hypothetical protein
VEGGFLVGELPGTTALLMHGELAPSPWVDEAGITGELGVTRLARPEACLCTPCGRLCGPSTGTRGDAHWHRPPSTARTVTFNSTPAHVTALRNSNSSAARGLPSRGPARSCQWA